MSRGAWKQVAYWSLLLLWTCMAVFLSRQTGEETAELSGGIAAWLMAVLGRLGIPTDPETLHAALRKAAHVVIYLVLGFLAYRAFRLSFRGSWVPAAAAGLCLAAAVLDEVQKALIPGRHCHWDEVALNVGCAAAGLLLGWLISRR